MIEGTISQREALCLGDLLSAEVISVDKLSFYANQANDPELKSICRDLANAHMRSFDRLLQQVQVSGGIGSTLGTATQFTGREPQIDGYTTGYGATNVGYGTSHVGSGFTSGVNTGYNFRDTGNVGISGRGQTNVGYGFADTGTNYGTIRS